MARVTIQASGPAQRPPTPNPPDMAAGQAPSGARTDRRLSSADRASLRVPKHSTYREAHLAKGTRTATLPFPPGAEKGPPWQRLAGHIVPANATSAPENGRRYEIGRWNAACLYQVRRLPPPESGGADDGHLPGQRMAPQAPGCFALPPCGAKQFSRPPGVILFGPGCLTPATPVVRWFYRRVTSGDQT